MRFAEEKDGGIEKSSVNMDVGGEREGWST